MINQRLNDSKVKKGSDFGKDTNKIQGFKGQQMNSIMYRKSSILGSSI